jgi:hypothetical protein
MLVPGTGKLMLNGLPEKKLQEDGGSGGSIVWGCIFRPKPEYQKYVPTRCRFNLMN